MKSKKQEADIMAYDVVKTATEDRKMKKFFRFAVPILIVEILVVIGCAVFYFITPKNYCVVTASPKNTAVYINNEKTNKVKFVAPKESIKYYLYDINISLKLPGESEYEVTFKVECEKYKVYASSIAVKEDNVYKMTCYGGEKTEIISGITIVSNKIIKNFTVEVKINAKKVEI